MNTNQKYENNQKTSKTKKTLKNTKNIKKMKKIKNKKNIENMGVGTEVGKNPSLPEPEHTQNPYNVEADRLLLLLVLPPLTHRMST